MDNRQEGLRNPLEVEHPFSAELSFSLPGAKLIDNQLIIATRANRKGELLLLLVVKKHVPVKRQRVILEEGWHSLDRREEEGGSFRKLNIVISEELGPLFIGDEYRMNYSGVHKGKLYFRLESTHPILASPVAPSLSYVNVLENLERIRETRNGSNSFFSY